MPPTEWWKLTFSLCRTKPTESDYCLEEEREENGAQHRHAKIKEEEEEEKEGAEENEVERPVSYTHLTLPTTSRV